MPSFESHSPIQQNMLVIGFLGGTTSAVILILLLIFMQQRKKRFNWYEQNLLDIAACEQRIVRQRPKRMQTEESDEIEYIDETRPQSRIRGIFPLHDDTTQAADLSGIFMVPRLNNKSSSMFRDLQSNQIDRGLYQPTMQDSESPYHDESIGKTSSIKLGLWIDENLNILCVALLQATVLDTKREDGQPNPYFRITLDSPGEPDKERIKSTQQSKIFHNSASPEINEKFYFQASAEKISQCKLEILIYDFDQFSVDECLGYCWLTLGRIQISTKSESPSIFWVEVLQFDNGNENRNGEILFSLTYLSKAQRLSMNIIKARSLKIDKSANHSVIAVRVTLISAVDVAKKIKRKKTSSRKNVSNPQFNESLSFGIAKNSLCDIVLEVEVINDYGTFGMGSKLLGRIELPIHQCKELWRGIIREEKSQARWYPLEEP